jgi:hypothetical protein
LPTLSTGFWRSWDQRQDDGEGAALAEGADIVEDCLAHGLLLLLVMQPCLLDREGGLIGESL